MNVQISTLSIADWSLYKELRLKALRQDSIAFLDSFEEALDKVDDYWMRHLNASEEDSITLFARASNKLVGMIAILFNTKVKTKHVAEIVGMYVDPKHRGKGIGIKLMQEIENKVREREDIKKIKLEVVETQEAAINLYKKQGFKVVGKLQNEFFEKGKYYDNLIMEKLL